MRRRSFLAIARHAGFTLIEAIMVIVITGVLAGMVAVFVKSPVDAYVSSARRADLSDAADTAVRRMGRDIRLALPNSVRNPSGAGQDQCIEFMPTRIGGRYRVAQTNDPTPVGDTLDFTAVDASFDMLWPNSALPAAQQIVADDIVVVYNDGSTSGDAYSGANAIQIASTPTEPGGSANTTAITFVGTAAATLFKRKQLPAESPAYRFQVIPANEHVVAYICSGGKLYRYARTLTAPYSTPAACPAVPAGTPILAENVSSCSIKYEPPGSGAGAGRYGIVSISLQITKSGESVSLYHQLHVDNTP